MRKNQKALFLDRDGVINVDTGYTHQMEDFSLIEGIIPLCQAAIAKEYLLIVITNQSGIARGLYNLEKMHSFHTHLLQTLKEQDIDIREIFYCPHHPTISGRCLCRKPGTLLLEKAMARYGVSPSRSWMIGDKERDVLAGQKCGCKTILFSPSGPTQADYRVESLKEAISLL